MNKLLKLLIVAIVGTVIAAIVIAIPLYKSASDRLEFGEIKSAQPPMTVTQVEKLMGQPSRVESSETTGITGSVYHYPSHGGDIKVVFVNGTVFNAEFVSGAKS